MSVRSPFFSHAAMPAAAAVFLSGSCVLIVALIAVSSPSLIVLTMALAITQGLAALASP